MATIKQKIAIEGGEEVKRTLTSLGDAGEDAFKKIQEAAKASAIDEVTKALNELHKVVTSSSADSQKLFKDLGVSVTDTNGKVRPANQLFGELAQKLRGMTDPAQQSATAVKLFGTNAGQVLDAIKGGASTVQQLVQSFVAVSQGAGGAGVSLATLSTGFAVLGGAVIGAATLLKGVVDHFQELALEGAKAANAIKEAADKAGLGTGDYQRLAQEVKNTGGEVKDLHAALAKLKDEAGKKAFEEATKDFEKAGKALGPFGSEVDASTGAVKRAREVIPAWDENIRKVTTSVDKHGNVTSRVTNSIKHHAETTRAAGSAIGSATQLYEEAGVRVTRFGRVADQAAKKTKEGLSDIEKGLRLLKLDPAVFNEGEAGLRKIVAALNELADGSLKDHLAKLFKVEGLLDIAKDGKEAVQSVGQLSRAFTEAEFALSQGLTRAQKDYTEAVEATDNKLGLAFGESFKRRFEELTAKIDEQRPAIVAAAQEIANGIEKALVGFDAGNFAKGFEGLGEAAGGGFKLGLAKVKPYFDVEKDFNLGLDAFRDLGEKAGKFFKDGLANIQKEGSQNPLVSQLSEADVKAEVAADGWSAIAGAIKGAYDWLFKFKAAQKDVDLTDADFVGPTQGLRAFNEESAKATAATPGWSVLTDAITKAMREIGILKSAEDQIITSPTGGGVRGELEGIGPAAKEATVQLASLTQEIGQAGPAMRSVPDQAPLFQSFAEAARGASSDIITAFLQIPDAVEQAMRDIGAAVDRMVSGVSSQLEALAQRIAQVSQAASSAGSGGIGNVGGGGAGGGDAGGGDTGDGFASGGYVRGPGGPRSDSILARLSNGEFVVNALATKKWLPLLRAINGFRMPKFDFGIPKFADGGLAMAGIGAGGGASRTVNVNLMAGGQTFRMMAPEDVADSLVTYATRQQARATGRPPGWSR